MFMKCQNPRTLKTGLVVPCRQCLACRINYREAWKLRCLYELDNWDSAAFITLTFSDKYLLTKENPDSLDKKELQQFFKRLRLNAERKYGSHQEVNENGNERSVSNKPIKYFACGEYGGERERPHYHAIVFGMDNFNDDDRDLIKSSWNTSPDFRCEDWMFDKERGRDSAIQEVTPDDIAYVCGYVEKKLFGAEANSEYTLKGRTPPFSLMSQGLGLDFALKNKERLFANAYTYTTTGKRIGLPAYLRDKLGINMAERLEKQEVKETKKQMLVRESQHLNAEFAKFLQKRGLTLTDSFLASNNYERLFNQFYDEHLFSYATQIYQNFLDKQKLRGIRQ